MGNENECPTSRRGVGHVRCPLGLPILLFFAYCNADGDECIEKTRAARPHQPVQSKREQRQTARVAMNNLNNTNGLSFTTKFGGIWKTVLDPVASLPCPDEPRPTDSGVRIGRTLQSFPPSKRSGRLSTHSAFQLGLWTLEERIRRHRRRGAPASKDRHLLSPLHPFASFLTGLP